MWIFVLCESLYVTCPFPAWSHQTERRDLTTTPHSTLCVFVCFSIMPCFRLRKILKWHFHVGYNFIFTVFVVVEWRDERGLCWGFGTKVEKKCFFLRVDLNQAFSTVATKLMFPYLDWNSKLDLSTLVIGCLRFIFMHLTVRVLWFLASFCVFKCDGTNEMNDSSFPPHVKSPIQLAV